MSAQSIDAAEIAKVLGGKKSGKGYSCHCPAHRDGNPSLSVSDADDGRVLFKCHGGCSQEDVMDALRDRGLFGGRPQHERPRKMKAKPNGGPWGPWKWIEPPYDYTDASGSLLYQVCRKEQFSAGGEKQKEFPQRRPDGNGGWIGEQGKPRVLYRWPDLLAHPNATVFVCEGEKDADRVASLGHCATTVANGNWNDVDVSNIAGRDVWILEDADTKGVSRALESASALIGVAKTLRIVRLPGQEYTASKHGKDVSDWLDEGHTVEELIAACADAPLWEPSSAPPEEPADESEPLAFVNMSDWHQTATPVRQWAVEDRIPMKQVYLFSGNGGTGKSLAELMRSVAHVTGREWFGMPVRKGPVIYLSAEDDEKELHIRLAAILRHYNTTFPEVIAGGLYLLDYAGHECILGAPDKSGIIRPTPLFLKLEEAALRIEPVSVVIDTVADTYAGSEIDRQQTTQFVKMGQRLAQKVGCSVALLAHPSVAGMASGTGLSGSTAWHNKVRARSYITQVPAEDGGDEDLRQIQFMKNNYGRQGDAIQVRWQAGVFVLENAADNDLKKRAQDRKVDMRFLDLLSRYEQQGRVLSDRPTSTNYAPKCFAAEKEGEKFSISLYRDAMDRLFSAHEIHVGEWGPPSKRVRHIVKGKRPEGS